MANYSVTFGQRLVNSIWEKGAPALIENAYDMHRVLDYMVKSRADFKKTDMSGPFLATSVNVRKMGITQMLLEGAEYSLANVETEQNTQIPWVTAVTPLVLTDDEIGENQDRARVYDVVKTRMGVAANDHSDTINNQLINGTGTAPSSHSLNTIVGNGDFAGISATTYPLFVSHVDAGSQNISATVLDKAIDATMFSSAQGIDTIISGLTVFDRFKDISQGKTTVFQQGTTDAANKSYSGIEVIQFRGATWFWDRLVPDTAIGSATNYLYCVDSRNLRMYTQKGADMTPQPPKEAPFQLAKHINIVSRFNFAPLSRRAHAKLTAVGVS